MSTMKVISTMQVAARLAALARAGATAEQAMRNFGEAGKVLRNNMPSVGDWRKYTTRNKRYE